MKILFLSYDGLTDPLGRSQIIPYLEGLSSKGNKIIILSLEKQQVFDQLKSTTREICQAAFIDWHYLFFPVNGNRLDQFRTSRAFNKKALTLAGKYQVDLVHCRSYPAAMAGRFIQKKTGLKWIFDIRGFWIDERIEGNIWNKNNILTKLIIKLLRIKEKSLYQNAPAVISLTHQARDIINSRFPLNGQERYIDVIPCCADYNFFKPADPDNKKRMRLSLGLPENGFVLTYLGSVGSWYMLPEMFDFFKTLLITVPNAYFLFISGENQAVLRKEALLYHIPDDRLIIYKAQREEVPQYLSAADCGIAFIKPVFSKSASSPVKWAETLACDIPVVVNDGVGDIATLRNQINGFIVVSDFSEKAYKKAIDTILSSIALPSGQIRDESRKVYDLQSGIQSYQNLYERLTARKMLFIASHRPNRAPNQRFRFEQYFPYFEHQGYQCHLSHLIDKSDDEYLYSHGYVLKKAWFLFVKSIFRRIKDVRKLKNYDLIYVAREATMSPTVIFERYFSKSKNGFIFDFDDSIWLNNVSAANRFFSWMKRPSKTAKIISLASKVIAGNQYLADYANQWNPKVMVIPTTVDTEKFKPTAVKPGQKEGILIGWTGSITTIPHFEFIIPVLLRIKEKYGNRVRFEVMGDTQFYHAELGIIGKPWSMETEIESISAFDIGLMPLPDDQWTKGKCGFKGLLCMSLGVPVIMSPVGVNNEIIQDGINGFLAQSEDEWFEKLSILIENEDLRTKFAQNGRQTVIDNYSLEAWKDSYLDVFNQLIHRGTDV